MGREMAQHIQGMVKKAKSWSRTAGEISALKAKDFQAEARRAP